MKNYKFVIGFLFSLPATCLVQAASVTPAMEVHVEAPAKVAGPVGLQSVPSTLLALNSHSPPGDSMHNATSAKAFHYLDGSGDAPHGVQTQTQLAQAKAVAEDLPEPASEVLMLAALSALAIAIRRQSKS